MTETLQEQSQTYCPWCEKVLTESFDGYAAHLRRLHFADDFRPLTKKQTVVRRVEEALREKGNLIG